MPERELPLRADSVCRPSSGDLNREAWYGYGDWNDYGFVSNFRWFGWCLKPSDRKHDSFDLSPC